MYGHASDTIGLNHDACEHRIQRQRVPIKKQGEVELRCHRVPRAALIVRFSPRMLASGLRIPVRDPTNDISVNHDAIALAHGI